ncbi:hypothetical protein [Paenibacillus macquariensis]|uniref:Lipoprotein n=1 Tax=Paenibacillus macquariensis TaxID=948756 RepID=A0ABY1K7N7_9BACL|nr:hypothetical protein [Paenibacillus macquariensis]MEC0091116.1 hypothetical protein [Paenibacillus macquariensis]OAB33700.1 hypothetical protein PMSM_13820 [Paenibacillus macquariensis subsp. macquariensis]SIR37698.1 hypothetical protein SAMN05421578_11266 [Paenibacillus macquariensis]
MNFKKPLFSAVVASVGCIILCLVLLFWNPYSKTPARNDTILIISIMLILPACLGIIASLLRSAILMFIVLVWSLPYGLYLSLVVIPSLWNLFGVVLILYLVSAIRMRRS